MQLIAGSYVEALGEDNGVSDEKHAIYVKKRRMVEYFVLGERVPSWEPMSEI